MINSVWFFLICFGILISMINGEISQLSEIIFESSFKSVEIAFRLIGPMALWSGLMKIARESNLTELIAVKIKPFFRLLFPDIKNNNSAMGMILLNLSANIFGLGNAATPLGIKAMEELQKVNPVKSTATPAMCTLLALNTSSLTLIPATIISLRAANGSHNPALITITTIFATGISTITAILLDRTFRVFSRE
ncbi:MAG: nucleoside recognition domain-containing protein [Bacillota bacterium]